MRSLRNELDAKVIDRSDGAQIGILFEARIPDVGTKRFLQFRCADGRDFEFPVPLNIKTALEAKEWVCKWMDLKEWEIRT